MKYFKIFIVFIIFDNTVRGNVDFDDEYVDSILDNYDVCEDSNKECEHWSSIGECDKNPSYMKTNCKVSCNTCDAGPDELKIPRLPKGKYSVCENYHEYCKMWSSVGECEKNPGYMHGNCKFSCKLCTPVSAPIIPPIEFSCGYEYILGFYYGKLNDGREVPAYFINQTKTKLEEQGHRTEVLDMIGDAISELKTCFKSKCHTYKFDGFFGVAPAGGKPAEKERAQYMAKIGVKDGDKIIFYCDGVVINRKWILSAAHCFFKSVNLNVVRMGDYDGSRVNRKTTLKYEFLTVDYPIDKVVFYPDYDIKERYHDLALIRLPQKTPEYASTIVPICLPWKYNNEDFEGKKVVLTGWGATAFGGTRTKVLQQVGLKVVSPLVCQKSYSKLPGFEKKHPYGLNYNNIMCVGADEVGKDACNGDSGGPLVLGLGETGKSEHFVLAGIVSGGFGCGLKEYPGLYIPINKDRYLRWIKEVAFKDFQ